MLWLWWLGCAEEDLLEATPEDTASVPSEIPTDDIAGWLKTGVYLDWPAEASIHLSAGPHFGNVRTYFSPDLAASIAEGNPQHPEGSAAVKELYGNGDTIQGFAVMVRVSNGQNGRAWYWYEQFENDNFADGRGVSLCTNCHEAGVDFLFTAPE
ncbi:MAG: hypothetical protein AAGA48_16430 [Myxococcota bacterium]